MCQHAQAAAGAIAYHGIANFFGCCQAKSYGGVGITGGTTGGIKVGFGIYIALAGLQNQSAPHLLIAFCDSQKLPPDTQRMKRWPVGCHRPDLS